MPWWYIVYPTDEAPEADADWLDSIQAEKTIQSVLVNAGYPEE